MRRAPIHTGYWLILASLLVLSAPASAFAVDLSFPEGLEMMQEGHEELLAAARREESRREALDAARGLYWPRIDARTRFTRMDDEITIDLNPIRQAMLKLHPTVPASVLPDFSLDVQDRSFWRSEVEMTWPIFTGGRITAANRSARAGVEEAAAQKDRSVQRLTSELVRRYFGLRVALRVLDVRQETLRELTEHLRQARLLEEAGVIARAERLHAEVAYTEADREVQGARKDVEIARIALADIVGGIESYEPVSPLFMVHDLGPLDSLREGIAGGHPMLREASAKRAQADEGWKAERARWFPEVYLFGMRELSRSDLTLLDPAWAVGVGASVTLFDGGMRRHRILAAQGTQREVALIEQRIKKEIVLLAEKRFRELLKAHERFVSLQASLGLGEENLRTRRLAFREGLATSLDVVAAERSLSGIRVERLRSAFSFDVSLAEYLEACGQSARFEAYRTIAAEEVP
ncbi:MAG: TolC family protein [Deltaproteobacteria bacterium]|nr:TolC family protein [Deltaproteobacteria bacterium]